MINYNGKLLTPLDEFSLNRGFYYADSVFETIKISNGKISFLEDHYFRLMASMRILRMRIPNYFTMEWMAEEIHKTTQATNARVKIVVYRDATGYYTPATNEVSYVIEATLLDSEKYILSDSLPYEVELFKDFYIPANLLSTIKSTNKQVQVLAAVFAKENDYQNCFLLNQHKNVVEAINGNIFILKEKELVTPPLTDGALNGIIRKQLLQKKEINDIKILEKTISTFDLQLADEIFITNTIHGVVSVTKYRKKEFTTQLAPLVVDYLNTLI
jgi:branched-chain amino acid aminotransferase